MEVLIYLGYVVFVLVCGYCFRLIIRHRFQTALDNFGNDFDDEEEIPDSETMVSSLDPMFGKYVTVNIAMMTGEFCTSSWNDGATELTVCVPKTDSKTNEKVMSFLDKLEKANPVKINVTWR